MKYLGGLCAGVVSLLLLAGSGNSCAGELVIETWRGEDVNVWQQQLIPAFTKDNPEISVRFIAHSPTEYDDAVEKRLAERKAGDLITCRPFDAAYKLYRKGYLQKLNGLAGLGNYWSAARQAWTSDDGLSLYCLPVVSVMHGFLYNKTLLAKLNLTAPKTEAEFFTLLEAIKAAGITPLAFGTKDQWETTQVVFTSIGPNRWHGEDGRLALLDGSAKFTDAPYVDTWKTMAKWAPYLPKNYRQVDYEQARNLFVSGGAAIYPAGSWEIARVTKESKFELGVFRPPPLQTTDNCYVSHHVDAGIGINRAGTNKEEAEIFLEWLTTKRFAEAFANALPGFFPLASHAVDIQNPIAKEVYRWRRACNSTIRLNSYVFNRGVPPMERQLWQVSSQVMNLELSPESAASKVQAQLETWFVPLQ